MKNLPDLGGMFQQMKLRDKLLEISDKPLLGFHIHMSLEKGIPLGEILTQIMEYYNADPDATLRIIPYSTIDLIKEVLKNKSHA
jgi:hypothetical protein